MCNHILTGVEKHHLNMLLRYIIKQNYELCQFVLESNFMIRKNTHLIISVLFYFHALFFFSQIAFSIRSIKKTPKYRQRTNK